MKYKIKFILRLLFIPLIAGCQPEGYLDKQNLIDTIIKDQDFISYMTALDQNTKQTIAKEVDLEALGPILSDIPHESPCEIPEDALSGVRGGVAWIRIICQIDTHLQALHKKYDFGGLDDELRKNIRATYRDQIGGLDMDELGKNILDTYRDQIRSSEKN